LGVIKKTGLDIRWQRAFLSTLAARVFHSAESGKAALL